jgi:hypothetical protein
VRIQNAVGVAWSRLLLRSLLLAIYVFNPVGRSPMMLAASVGTAGMRVSRPDS